MALVRTSASRSITSVFDAVTVTASSLGKTVGAVGQLADALDSKVDAFATEVQDRAVLTKLQSRDKAISAAIVERVERLEEFHRLMKLDGDFDRTAALNESTELFTKAFA